MGLKATVLINGVNNLSDARYCAGMGVDYLGFELEEDSPNFTSPEKYKELMSWVSGPESIGEFKNSTIEEILTISSNYSIDTIQISNIELVKDLKENNKIVLFEVSPELAVKSTFEDLKDQVQFFIWNQGDQDPQKYQELVELAAIYPIILGGDFSMDKVDEVDQLPFKGYALKGGNEVKPGYREFDEMADILESLEELD